MLNSINPMFDNIEFKELINDCEDLFDSNLDREFNMQHLDSTFVECENNVAFGNRNNLMLIQNYHEIYKKQLNGQVNRPESEI